MGHAWPTRRLLAAGSLGLVLLACALTAAGPASARRAGSTVVVSEPRALNGSGNNLQHPEWGVAGSRYVRLATADYADGVSQPVSGPNPRYVSNRVFNSLGVDLFSPRNVSQWVWVWGQFLDHNFELAEGGSEELPISVDQNDPLESFSDSLGVMPFVRDAPATGSGTSTQNPRQQVNTVPSYIDGYAVYGGTQSRLEWLRTGPDNGNPEEAGASLMLPGGYLPVASARGDVAGAPKMVEEGSLTPRSCGDRRRRPHEREHRPRCGDDAVCQGAQPDRLAVARIADGRTEVPDRPPRRGRRDPVHHLHGLPPCRGSPARPLQGLQPRRRSRDNRRIRNRRLPRALDGQRRGGNHRPARARTRPNRCGHCRRSARRSNP